MSKILSTSLIAAVVFPLLSSMAQAQVAVDVSNITCEQFRGYRITDPNNIAIWLDGYYSAKRGTTIVQVEAFKDNVQKLNNYCITNPTVTVMQAVQTMLAK
jgi:hypothetical protein